MDRLNYMNIDMVSWCYLITVLTHRYKLVIRYDKNMHILITRVEGHKNKTHIKMHSEIVIEI